MKSHGKEELMGDLARYGYALSQPAPVTREPEEVFKNLLKQDDPRLLEGFPVVLAYALKEKEALAWERSKLKRAFRGEPSKKSQQRSAFLLGVSYLLFRLFGLDKKYEDRVLKLLSGVEEGKQTLANLTEPFMRSESVSGGGVTLSVERLKNTFRNYVTQAGESSRAVQEKKRDLELELLLSELFTPRQKELLRKRLEGKAFTKTEREYFYRVVKKRLKALANEDLHRLARDLVLK